MSRRCHREGRRDWRGGSGQGKGAFRPGGGFRSPRGQAIPRAAPPTPVRPLLFVLSLSALSIGSYVGLTQVWAPEPSTSETTVVETSGVTSVARSAGGPPVPTRASTSGVRTSLATKTYAVQGSTADELLSSMADQAPRPDGEVFFGLTEAEIGLRFRPTPVPGGCLLRDVEIDLTLTVTLPEWTPAPPSDRALARDWGRFRRALASHEDRHTEIAEGGAQRMLRAIDGLRRQSCEVVSDEAQRRLERLEIEVEATQRRYDSETGHGRTEGAVWPQ